MFILNYFSRDHKEQGFERSSQQYSVDNDVYFENWLTFKYVLKRLQIVIFHSFAHIYRFIFLKQVFLLQINI